jgi:Spy/CpxP family protein refolding chaperone
MRAQNIILAIAAAVVIAAPGAVLAQGPPGGGGAWGHGPHGGGFDGGPGDGLGIFDRMLPRLADSLGLTDDQLTRIQTILDDARPEIEDLAAQLRAGREAYREAHDDPASFDEGAFRSHAAEQAQIRIDLMVLTHSTRAKAFAVLTPEQLAQLEEMRGDFGRQLKRRSGGRRSS